MNKIEAKVPRMARSIEQWRAMEPLAVATGSLATAASGVSTSTPPAVYAKEER